MVVFELISCQWFCCEQPEAAERRPINLIIRVESQIGGISRQELSAKAADLKMSVNLIRLAAHYFYKLTFCFQSAKVIPMFYERDNISGIDTAVLMRRGRVRAAVSSCLAQGHFS